MRVTKNALMALKVLDFLDEIESKKRKRRKKSKRKESAMSHLLKGDDEAYRYLFRMRKIRILFCSNTL